MMHIASCGISKHLIDLKDKLEDKRHFDDIEVVPQTLLSVLEKPINARSSMPLKGYRQ